MLTIPRNGHFKSKKITFLHFSPNLSWLFQRNFVGTLLGVRGTLSGNLTSNDLDLRKGQKLHFCTFSGQISTKMAWKYFLWCLVNFSDFFILFVIFNNYYCFMIKIKKKSHFCTLRAYLYVCSHVCMHRVVNKEICLRSSPCYAFFILCSNLQYLCSSPRNSKFIHNIKDFGWVIYSTMFVMTVINLQCTCIF